MTNANNTTDHAKAGKIRTAWIIVMSCLYTANTCTRAALRGLFGTISRPWCDHALRLYVKRVLKLVGVTCTVVNPFKVQPVAGQPTIIMCNHSSLYDIPLSLFAFPSHSLRMLAKKELGRIPLMGQGMVAAEFPFIDRQNRQQAKKDLEYVKTLLASGILMWIAPEGTRSKTGKLAPFKKGGFITAIQAGAVIIPMGIRGAHKILPARTHQFNLNQSVEVHIGQPIDASAFTLENKEALIEEVFESMKQLVGEGEKSQR